MRAPAARATVSDSFGETSRSKKTVLICVATDQPDEIRELARARLRLGVDPGDRNLVEAVARREVAKRGMAGHELAAPAIGEPAPILRVELPHAGCEHGRARWLTERRADPRHDAREEERIEPNVRIRLACLVADAGFQRQAGQRVELLPRRGADRFLDGRLEPVGQIEHQLCLLQVADLPRGQLDVVRLCARRRQVLDGDGSVRRSPLRRRRAGRRPSRPTGGQTTRLGALSHTHMPARRSSPARR